MGVDKREGNRERARERVTGNGKGEIKNGRELSTAGTSIATLVLTRVRMYFSNEMAGPTQR
eukprot:1070276-Pyramimonas_sp.AAC.2